MRTGYWNYHNNHPEHLSPDPLRGDCSTKTTLWNKILALNIPPRVKIFVWKFAHDIIASEANLVCHHVPGSPRCVLCGFYWSNANHSILFYQEVKEAWRGSSWWHIFKNLKGSSPAEVLDSLCKELNKDDFECLCTKMWGVWKDRCTHAHKHKAHAKLKEPQRMGQWTDTYLYDFQKAQIQVSPRDGSLVAKYR